MLLPYAEDVAKDPNWYALNRDLQLAIAEMADGKLAGEPIETKGDLNDALALCIGKLSLAYGNCEITNAEHGDVITNLLTPIWMHFGAQFKAQEAQEAGA